MPSDDTASGIDQNWRVETELRNAARYLGDLRVRVASGILGVRCYFNELPMFDPLRHRLRKHSSPREIKVEEPFGECALRWPVEPCLWFLYTGFQRLCKSELQHNRSVTFYPALGDR